MDDLIKDDPSTQKLPKGPKLRLGPVAPVAEPVGNTLTMGVGHNTYRPDIYRTTEGYHN